MKSLSLTWTCKQFAFRYGWVVPLILFFRCIKCWEMSSRLMPLETKVLWLPRREGQLPLLPFVPCSGPNGLLQRRGVSQPLTHVNPVLCCLPPTVKKWRELQLPGTWTAPTETSWRGDLIDTELPAFDSTSWRRKYLVPVTKALHHSSPLWSTDVCPSANHQWKLRLVNAVIRERMELVCNVFQSHDISSLIFNGRAYT